MRIFGLGSERSGKFEVFLTQRALRIAFNEYRSLLLCGASTPEIKWNDSNRVRMARCNERKKFLFLHITALA
jgi:hypothetical protein